MLMNNRPENNSSTPEKRKSPVAIIAIAILIVGAIALLVYNSDISSGWKNESSDSTEIAELPSESTDQLLDGKDAETGLLTGEGFELVKGNCTACHSSALILQSGFSREVWHEKIVWMQETQGLWDLGASESVILDYLAANYGPKESQGRRKPLTGIDWYELKD